MGAATGESSHGKTVTANVEKDSRRLFPGLTLMPCGLYIWLADYMAKGIHLEQREHADKSSGQTKALDNKDSHAQ